LIRRNVSEYKTSQFALYKLMYERALIDPRRTSNPEEAGSFFIPYDFGMDATFFESNGRMRKTHCPLATNAITLLKESPYFKANYGHDHTLVISVNQNMNYFFFAKACTEMLMLCWNCTKLAIDEYLFVAKDRSFEMKSRGINWHAVPFPSDYHFDSRVFGTTSHAVQTASGPLQTSKSPHIAPWEWPQQQENRTHLISFLGNPRKFSAVSTLLREALVKQCINHSDVCSHGMYNHEAHESPNYDSRRSVFCLQPPGDMPTRKSVFDVILSGCIPVLFHPLTARYMYEWHWLPSDWDAAAVHFDSFEQNQQLLTHQVDFIQRLIDLYFSQPQEVLRIRQRIREQAFTLQYSLVYRDGHSHQPVVSQQVSVEGGLRKDAYEVAMSTVLAIHYGERAHSRVANYVSCQQLPGAGRVMLQTAEWCNVTARDSSPIEDPYSPPATVSVFLGDRKKIGLTAD